MRLIKNKYYLDNNIHISTAIDKSIYIHGYKLEYDKNNNLIYKVYCDNGSKVKRSYIYGRSNYLL